MKVLMVLSDNTFPPDIRVEKEARALLDAGHEVHLICRKRVDQTSHEDVMGIRVRRIGLRQEFIIDHALMFVLVFLDVINHSRKHDAAVVHVHDIPLAIPAILAARIVGKKSVLDLHENYSAMVGYSGPVKRKGLPMRVVTRILEWAELAACRMADWIIVVVEEAGKRLMDKGIPGRNIVVISNHVDIEKLNALQITGMKLKKPCLVYSGGLSLHRGMDTVLEALGHISDKTELHLYIVGGTAGELAKSDMGKRIKAMGLEDRVTMTGWLPFREAMGYVRSGDICIIPHHRNPHTEATMPHKIFQYMYMEKPVIVSDLAPLKAVVRECECGMIFRAGDPEDLASKIEQMLDRRDEWAEMGARGRRAVIEKYNWEMEAGKLLSLYEKLEAKE